jgi:predicted nucleic acid-binding protein
VIYVDTSAWFAGFVPGDPNHRLAAAFFAATPIQQLVTSDYILSEFLTLLKVRHEAKRAFELGQQILDETICQMIWVEKVDVFKAWIYFDTYRDKGWSFTDCASRALMERLRIDSVFAFDQHFHEFGNLTVVP